MKKKSKKEAYTFSIGYDDKNSVNRMTNRELIAMNALEGLLAGGYENPEYCATTAVKYADALIDALANKKFKSGRHLK